MFEDTELSRGVNTVTVDEGLPVVLRCSHYVSVPRATVTWYSVNTTSRDRWSIVDQTPVISDSRIAVDDRGIERPFYVHCRLLYLLAGAWLCSDSIYLLDSQWKLNIPFCVIFTAWCYAECGIATASRLSVCLWRCGILVIYTLELDIWQISCRRNGRLSYKLPVHQPTSTSTSDRT